MTYLNISRIVHTGYKWRIYRNQCTQWNRLSDRQTLSARRVLRKNRKTNSRPQSEENIPWNCMAMLQYRGKKQYDIFSITKDYQMWFSLILISRRFSKSSGLTDRDPANIPIIFSEIFSGSLELFIPITDIWDSRNKSLHQDIQNQRNFRFLLKYKINFRL